MYYIALDYAEGMDAPGVLGYGLLKQCLIDLVQEDRFGGSRCACIDITGDVLERQVILGIQIFS